MDKLLIDTDVLIDHLRGIEHTKVYLRKKKDGGNVLSYSVITKTELYSGLREGEEESISSLLGAMMELNVNGEIAEAAGLYMRRFYKSHGLLVPDALIAATAKISGATLITSNIKHLPMKDISIESPY
jgi:predicted nucleic acid-binding protein